MNNLDTIYLPISTGYVKHWSFWEAVRELIQNKVDQGTGSVYQEGNNLLIKTEGALLDVSTLLLGESSKSDDSTKIGCYGEGYKLALLVLNREGYKVTIQNGLDLWETSIKSHPQLGGECLAIDIMEDFYANPEDADKMHNQVVFEIEEVTEENIEEIFDKYLVTEEDFTDYCHDSYGTREVIIEEGGSQMFKLLPYDYDEEEDYEIPKRLFVGGLFVCDLDDNFRYSYNFAPNVLQLDRDRQSVNTFSLGYAVYELLVDSQNIEMLIDMVDKKCPDVGDYGHAYATSGTVGKDGTTTNVGKISSEHFYKKYGVDAFPISDESSQQVINVMTAHCIALGLVPIVVRKLYYQMLPDSMKELKDLPKANNKKAWQVLEGFLETHGKFLKSQPKRYLKNLIVQTKLGGN